MLYLDQGIGVHHAQVESLGYGWTWVSGEGAAPVIVSGPHYIDASQAYRAGSGQHDFMEVGPRASQAYRPGSIAFDAIEVGSRASQAYQPGSQEGDYR